MRRTLISVAALSLALASPSSAQQTTVLRAARLIDGTGAPTVTNAAIVVTGDRIVAVGPAATVALPVGARVVDLGDVTLLPGFIDAHTHIIGRTLGDPLADLAVVKDYPSYGAIAGVANARKTLMAGFTTIQSPGQANDVRRSPTAACQALECKTPVTRSVSPVGIATRMASVLA